MKLEYFGHAFWKISTQDISIAIDPYDNIGYPMKEVQADVVIISHDHHDHNNLRLIKSYQEVYRNAGVYEFKDLKVRLVPVWHDEVKGNKRGRNHLIQIQLEGKTVIHCGDLGHLPDKNTLLSMFRPDALLVPVGEIYTLSISNVFELIRILDPTLVFPMHYQTPVCTIRLGELRQFTDKALNVIQLNTNTYTIDKNIPVSKQTIVLNWQPAKE